MALEDLAQGDIIVESGADHCVMWVGEPQPLAHSTSKGVIQQSDAYFRETARPVLLGSHTVWRLDPKSRAKWPDLATSASEVASDWANNRSRDTNRTKV